MNVILIAAITADGYIARHSNEIVEWSLDLQLFKLNIINNKTTPINIYSALIFIIIIYILFFFLKYKIIIHLT